MGYNRHFHRKRNKKPIYNELAEGINALGSFDSILDIGCSSGVMMQKTGIKDKVGIDYFITYDQFICDGMLCLHDLNTSPKILSKKFPIIICQETVEHIFQQNEDNVFQTIKLNLDKDGIVVFSGAMKWQKGRGHVNCQDKPYWVTKMNQIGLDYDEELTKLYISKITGRITWNCYKRNTMVFK